jgi:hypothetical protein
LDFNAQAPFEGFVANHPVLAYADPGADGACVRTA